jgi:hypothetical protein
MKQQISTHATFCRTLDRASASLNSCRLLDPEWCQEGVYMPGVGYTIDNTAAKEYQGSALRLLCATKMLVSKSTPAVLVTGFPVTESPVVFFGIFTLHFITGACTFPLMQIMVSCLFIRKRIKFTEGSSVASYECHDVDGVLS